MKMKKTKVIAIITSIGLSTGALTACSSPNNQIVDTTSYKNYKCDKNIVKNDKVQCEDTTTSSHTPIFIPSNYVTKSGGIKSGFVKSSTNTIGTKGIGSSRSPVNS